MQLEMNGDKCFAAVPPTIAQLTKRERKDLGRLIYKRSRNGRKWELQKSMFYVHEDRYGETRKLFESSRTTSAPTGRSSFECSRCKKLLGTSSSLLYHCTSHTQETPFECIIPQCKKRLVQRTDVLRHYEKHLRNWEIILDEGDSSEVSNRVEGATAWHQLPIVGGARQCPSGPSFIGDGAGVDNGAPRERNGDSSHAAISEIFLSLGDVELSDYFLRSESADPIFMHSDNEAAFQYYGSCPSHPNSTHGFNGSSHIARAPHIYPAITLEELSESNTVFLDPMDLVASRTDTGSRILEEDGEFNDHMSE